MADVNALQQLVDERLRTLGGQRGPMSARQAASRSGERVSYETVRKILTGSHSGRINDDTAQGLALALDVPVSRIYKALNIPVPLGRFELPPRADRLSFSQRKAVVGIVNALVAASEGGKVEDAVPEVPLRSVARKGEISKHDGS